jgi:hypothetical protein
MENRRASSCNRIWTWYAENGDADFVLKVRDVDRWQYVTANGTTLGAISKLGVKRDRWRYFL